jgi:hypothetical protein
MIAHAVNSDLMFDEEPEKKPLKRRLLVASLLSLAAFGAHQLHGRMHPLSAPQEALASSVVTADATAPQVITGPNSLFGDAVVDQKFDAPVASSLGSYEMDLVSTIDQGGLARETSPAIEGLDSASFRAVDVAGGSSSAAVAGAFSAVPEPASAGLLLLVAAPALGLRRKHHRAQV